ncbi:helix-turn-helix domain-containing protein [Amycolatopsis tolypomycina]|uniref:helix-turn-helix domain-containing protein n=1 Tax=Amycolatopsis tolypomycina TaxID=208445 RepID=UPI0033A1F72D
MTRTAVPWTWQAARLLADAVLGELRRALPGRPELRDGRAWRFVASNLHHALTGADAAWQGAGAELFRHLGATGCDARRVAQACAAGSRRALAALDQPPAGVVCACAEALFACLEALSALTTSGGAAPSGKRLLDAILTGAENVEALAHAARWPVPDRVVLVALERGATDPGAPALADLDAPQPCLLFPAGAEIPGFGTRAALGPRVRPAEAAKSLYWARRTLALVRNGVLPDRPLTDWADHLTTHCLLADEFLTRTLADQALSPLDTLSPARRTKAADTLLALLSTGGSAPEISRLLGVHPQTVRHRLRLLTVLFGARLTDPAERLTLEIALRSRKLGPAAG